MDRKIVKIDPYFEPRMWGGPRFKENFHFVTDVSPIGEAYCVVALKNHADCPVRGENMTLAELYESRPDWFNCDTAELPVRINLLDAAADLSVQLHPDDDFARQYNGGRGKPEAWVILDAPRDAYIEFGHTAQTREEFIDKVNRQDFKSLLKYLTVVKDAFIDIPAGTLHAVGRRFDDLSNRVRLDPYLLVDLRAEYRFSDALRVQARIENLFDEEYETAAYYNQPGRGFFVTLRYEPGP